MPGNYGKMWKTFSGFCDREKIKDTAIDKFKRLTRLHLAKKNFLKKNHDVTERCFSPAIWLIRFDSFFLQRLDCASFPKNHIFTVQTAAACFAWLIDITSFSLLLLCWNKNKDLPLHCAPAVIPSCLPWLINRPPWRFLSRHRSCCRSSRLLLHRHQANSISTAPCKRSCWNRSSMCGCKLTEKCMLRRKKRSCDWAFGKKIMVRLVMGGVTETDDVDVLSPHMFILFHRRSIH